MGTKKKTFPKEVFCLIDEYDGNELDMFAYSDLDEAYDNLVEGEVVGVYRLVRTAKITRKVELVDAPATKAKGK